MIKIIIEGPQGCGKTRLAEMFSKILSFGGKAVLIVEGKEKVEAPKHFDVIIRIK